EQDHHADDGADQPAEVEHLVVPDPEELGEDEEADHGAGEAEQHRGDESHLVAARHEQPPDVPGDDAQNYCSDHGRFIPSWGEGLNCQPVLTAVSNAATEKRVSP